MERTHGKFEMDKFDGKGDFGMWKYKMMAQLEIQSLLAVIQDDFVVASTFCTCLSDSILRKIMHEQTALGMWKSLEKLYQLKSLPNRIYLKRQFSITDEDQAIQLLSGLPAAYEQLVHTLQYGTGRDTLTVSEVVTSAYSKEAELRQKGLLNKKKSTSEGLYVESRGRSSKRSDNGNNKKYGRSRSRSDRSNSRGKSSKGKKGTCFSCGKEGHWKRECPNRGQRNNGEQEVNAATKIRQPLVLTASIHDSRKEWVLDSGCTFHITPDKEVLFDLHDGDGSKVLMANNTQCEVKGIGKIRITNEDGSVIILKDVRYMPDMSRNLISYGMLEKSGCNYQGGNFKVTFYKDRQKVITGKYENGLYYLQGTVSRGEVNISASVDNNTKVWHSRLGHMSSKNMELLVKEGFLPKTEVGKLEFCEGCVLGKSHKQSFPTAKHTTKGILEYVHSDLWGSPSTPESLGGCKYFISFIDDFSKKVWVYFLRTKDEAFAKFREWKEAVEGYTEKKIKCLRTDNGLEYCNNQFDELCRVSGVKRHRTCTYTPQQNGVSERMNRTIMDKVRSMLAETGLGQEFWAEATSTAVYLINRTPNSTIDFKLPEEVWSGNRPDLSHLRRFGCTAYVHVNQEKTKPRAVKGVFVGYPFGVKGYRVWIP